MAAIFATPSVNDRSFAHSGRLKSTQIGLGTMKSGKPQPFDQ